MHIPRDTARRFFGEIRAFTTDEIARMQSELARVGNVIAQRRSDLSDVSSKPWNYILQTQRDAITRMENGIAQDQAVYDQLSSSFSATVESGDTDKLQGWLDLAAVVGDAGDVSVWKSQVQYAQTSAMVTTVAKETAKDIKNPFGVPWWMWVGGAGVLWFAFGRRR